MSLWIWVYGAWALLQVGLLGGWSQPNMETQQVSGMPISWYPFRCGFFQGWSPGVEPGFFVQIFNDFFLKRVGGKHFLVEQGVELWISQREMIQIIAKSSWYLRYCYYFFPWKAYEVVPCPMSIPKNACHSGYLLISNPTSHISRKISRSGGIHLFVGKPFFQHEENVFVGWMCEYETGDLKGFSILRLFVNSKKILLLQSSKDLALFFCEAMKMVPIKVLLPTFSDIFSISLLYDFKQLTWFI